MKYKYHKLGVPNLRAGSRSRHFIKYFQWCDNHVKYYVLKECSTSETLLPVTP